MSLRALLRRVLELLGPRRGVQCVVCRTTLRMPTREQALELGWRPIGKWWICKECVGGEDDAQGV